MRKRVAVVGKDGDKIAFDRQVQVFVGLRRLVQEEGVRKGDIGAGWIGGSQITRK